MINSLHSLFCYANILYVDDKNFWYIACESKDLDAKNPQSIRLFDEWIVLFRNELGQITALQDRCLHRSSQLSRGQVIDGCLRCPYHGWTYDHTGEVICIPAEGPNKPRGHKQALSFPVIEQEGYIYITLQKEILEDIRPFAIPFFGKPGYAHIRLINKFKNNVTNCAENFVDVPHTVFVHPTIFRQIKKTTQKMIAQVQRKAGSVIVDYKMETDNFGIFSWFLNSSGKEIVHKDSFHMPNVTHVEYIFGPKRHFNITSQSIPLGENETLVYTDLTYNYGFWNHLAKPLIRWQAQAIINQDIDVLDNQMKTMEKYGAHFMNSPVDVIHILIESVRNEIEQGRDPRLLPEKNQEVEFWI